LRKGGSLLWEEFLLIRSVYMLAFDMEQEWSPSVKPGVPKGGILKRPQLIHSLKGAGLQAAEYKIGLISGASTPQWLVKQIVRKINLRKEKLK